MLKGEKAMKKRKERAEPASSFDSFPVATEDYDSMDSDDIVVRAAKRQKLEESGIKKEHHPAFQSSQSSLDQESNSAASISQPLTRESLTIPLGDTVLLETSQSIREGGRISRNNTSSLDILSDPSFSFPPGPVQADSPQLLLIYDVDDED